MPKIRTKEDVERAKEKVSEAIEESRRCGEEVKEAKLKGMEAYEKYLLCRVGLE